jgi:DNA-binding transcriptional MerR regulator
MAEQRPVVIPDKLYFRIGEVSRLTRTEAYVLRFWEKEFPMLKPVKSSSGHRMYRRKDVEMVLEIKKLLYKEGFTIEGARKKLRSETKQSGLPFPRAEAQKLKKIREELDSILRLLAKRN